MKLGRLMSELHLKWELRILCLTVHMSKSINSAEKKMTYKPVNQLTDPPVSDQLWVMIDWPVKLFSSSWPTCTHNSQTKPLQGLSNCGGEHCCLKARRSGFWILSVWNLHVLLVTAWIVSRYSGFLPLSKDMREGRHLFLSWVLPHDSRDRLDPNLD